MNEIREMAIESSKEVQVLGFEFLGRSTEGLVFENVETEEYFVIKVIAKKEGFEATEAIEEYEEKQSIAEEKASKAEAKKALALAKKEEAEAKAKALKEKREASKEE